MDRHLNAFLPYERPPHHEDQLTRAGMIVMRASPLARDALLGRLGALQCCPTLGMVVTASLAMSVFMA